MNVIYGGHPPLITILETATTIEHFQFLSILSLLGQRLLIASKRRAEDVLYPYRIQEFNDK